MDERLLELLGERQRIVTRVLELAVRHVLAAGGDVEVLHDNPRLIDAGRIGALLRY